MKFLYALHCAILTLFLLIVCLPVAQAQRNVIKFDPQNCDRFTYGFRNIVVLDQRPDTLGAIGYVKIGLMSRYEFVQTKGPLSTEIAAYYRTQSEKATTNSGKDLVVVIHDMMATEDGAGISREFAFFRYRAEYFIGEQDAYRSLGVIDTMVEISALDVTARLMKKIDQCLCSFCGDLLEHQPSGSGPFYTLAEVSRADVVRRMKMPAYTAKVFPDGIYPTWPDFLQLKYLENKKLLEHRKKHFIAQGISKKGKPYTFGVVAFDPDRPIDPGRIIVFGGIPYKAFEGRFFPMTFAEDSNFHFRGSSSRYRPSVPGVLIPVITPGGGMVFVVSGGGAKQEEYDFTINWRTGSIAQKYQILDPKAKRSQ